MRFLRDSVSKALAGDANTGMGQFSFTGGAQTTGARRRRSGPPFQSSFNTAGPQAPRGRVRVLRSGPGGTIGTACPGSHPDGSVEGICCTKPDSEGNVRCISQGRPRSDVSGGEEGSATGFGQFYSAEGGGGPTTPRDVGESCSRDQLCSSCCRSFIREKYDDCVESCANQPTRKRSLQNVPRGRQVLPTWAAPFLSNGVTSTGRTRPATRGVNFATAVGGGCGSLGQFAPYPYYPAPTFPPVVPGRLSPNCGFIPMMSEFGVERLNCFCNGLPAPVWNCGVSASPY